VEAAEDLRRLPRNPFPADENSGGADADEPPPAPRIRLAYPDSHFDGILVWDVVDYLNDATAENLTRELDRLCRPGALLSLFSDSRRNSPEEPLLRYRISSEGILSIEPIHGPPVQRVSRVNRDFFRLFPRFEVVKSTILRNQLREVLLRHSG
jgi:SAM-dependent methyltransferase